MTRIQRRRASVKLYHGHYQQALADLVDEGMAALRSETVEGRRFSQKSEATAKAVEYDRLVKEAEDSTVTVTVYALRFDEMDDLRDEHPPRKDEALDKIHGVNMKTFPRALTAAALVPPGEAEDFEDLKAKGAAALLELDVSKVNYQKLAEAAWNVNAGDDAIPKVSFASLLREAREPDSKPQQDSESAPRPSRAKPRPRRTSTSTLTETSPDEQSSPENPTGTTAPAPAP